MVMDSKGIARKNVTLLTIQTDGITSYKLIDAQGVVPAFTAYANILAERPFNTRKTYCHAIADFFDYFYEACFYSVHANESTPKLTRAELRKVIEFWHDYLTVGEDSGKDLVRLVCTTLPSPRVSKSTAALKNAALASFLVLSDSLREETAALVSLKLMTSQVEIDPAHLFESVHKVMEVGLYERQAMIANSMFAGVIAGGPKLKKRTQRVVKAIAYTFDMSRVFPFESIVPFIDSMLSYRDKALYSLYAASGCRSHEGLQLLWSDIDVTARTVSFVNPSRRWNDPSYRFLTAKDRDKLAWKGRETDLAFLIEPYKSMFFEHLEKYIRKEYYPHNQHQFIFQSTKGKYRGKPYFLTAQQTRQQIFDTAVLKCGLSADIGGVHSFRHAYATYLLNYIALGNGKYGLPIGMVKVMMGHASVKATEKYAVHDKDLIQSQLNYANALIFKGGSPQPFNEMKLEVLRAELSKYERYINKIDTNAASRLEAI